MRNILILIAILVATSALAAEQEKPKSNLRQTKTESYQKGTEQRPIFVRTLPTPKNEEETKREEQERSTKSLYELLLTSSTVWLAIVTTILAVFTAYLWGATRKLVVGAKDTTERQLRAYINISQGKVINIQDPENRTFNIMFQNFGQTPAHNVSVVSECLVREYPLNTDNPLRKIADSEHVVFSVLGPTCTYWQGIPVPCNYEWEQKIIDGSAAIYCHGEIQYIDAFEKPRVTTFRYMCGDGATLGDARPHEEGNNAI